MERVTQDAASDPEAPGASRPSQSEAPRRFPVPVWVAGLGVLIVLAVGVGWAVSAASSRETIEPLPGVYSKMPEGWAFLSSSGEGTTISEDGFGPDLAPEEYKDLDSIQEAPAPAVSMSLMSAGGGARCEIDEFVRGSELPKDMPDAIVSGYDEITLAGSKMDGGESTVAGRPAVWTLSHGAIASPWGVPGSNIAADYPNYMGTTILSVCIEDIDLSVSYIVNSALFERGSEESPTAESNASVPESREEVHEEIRRVYEANVETMTQFLEDVSTDGSDGPTELDNIPTSLESYDEALADPFQGELSGETPEEPESEEMPEPDTTSVSPESTGLTYEEAMAPGEDLQQFVSDYYEAVARQDWTATYLMLAFESQEEFSEEEWVEVQEARVAADGASPPLESATALTSGEGSIDSLIDVELTYGDGTSETLPIGVVYEDGLYKRRLTEEEISYLESL